MHVTATPGERTGAPATLKPLPDQPESWIAHEKPIPFDQAAELVLQAHRQDSARDDTLVHDLRTRAFGTADQEHMALARVPLPGRDTGKPLPLREQALGQLCQKIGGSSALRPAASGEAPGGPRELGPVAAPGKRPSAAGRRPGPGNRQRKVRRPGRRAGIGACRKDPGPGRLSLEGTAHRHLTRKAA
jgi:hypothetical protein